WRRLAGGAAGDELELDRFTAILIEQPLGQWDRDVRPFARKQARGREEVLAVDSDDEVRVGGNQRRRDAQVERRGRTRGKRGSRDRLANDHPRSLDLSPFGTKNAPLRPGQGDQQSE